MDTVWSTVVKISDQRLSWWQMYIGKNCCVGGNVCRQVKGLHTGDAWFKFSSQIVKLSIRIAYYIQAEFKTSFIWAYQLYSRLRWLPYDLELKFCFLSFSSSSYQLHFHHLWYHQLGRRYPGIFGLIPMRKVGDILYHTDLCTIGFLLSASSIKVIDSCPLSRIHVSCLLTGEGKLEALVGMSRLLGPVIVTTVFSRLIGTCMSNILKTNRKIAHKMQFKFFCLRIQCKSRR